MSIIGLGDMASGVATQGWQCPCCRVVKAPTVMECHCQQMNAGLSTLGGPMGAAYEPPNGKYNYNPVYYSAQKECLATAAEENRKRVKAASEAAAQQMPLSTQAATSMPGDSGECPVVPRQAGWQDLVV